MAAGGPGGQYRINLVWTSHGGQVLATMGQIQSGMRQVGGTSVNEGRNLGYFNRQMMAIGTTMRYFFAGGAIFGTMNAFSQFAEFQSKLGDLAAISPTFDRGTITEIGNELLRQSTALATPVTELEQSARNIQSTLQDLDPEQVTRFTELFGKGALVAETDAYNFGNAVMGMRNAFNLSLSEMGTVADEFFQVISLSAGMTGDEWAKFSGRVVAGSAQAGASLEEMNAITVLMTREGATAATNVRHLAQFMMQLRNPTQEAIPFWRQIGLDPQTLRTAPFRDIISKLLGAIRERGGLRRLKSSEIMAMEEDMEFMPTKPGGGISLLMDLFGRIESRRAAMVVLGEMLNPPEEGNKSYEELLRIFESSTAEADNLNAAVERALDRKRIQQAGIALRNMFIDALNPAERLINRTASWITDQSDPRIAQGAAAALAAYGLFRVGRGTVRGLGGLGRWARGLGGAGVMVNQMGAAPTGTFTNPFWVIIHPISNAPGFGGLPIPGGGGRGTPGGAGRGGWRGRIGGAGRFLRFAGPAGTAAWFLADAEEAGGGVITPQVVQRSMNRNRDFITPRFEAYARRMMGGNPTQQELARAMTQNMWVWRQGFMRDASNFAPTADQLASAMRVEERMRSHTAVEENRLGVFVDVSEDAKKLLKVNVTSSGKRSRVHVPVGHSAWQGGATPQFRGHPKTIRGGN